LDEPSREETTTKGWAKREKGNIGQIRGKGGRECSALSKSETEKRGKGG